MDLYSRWMALRRQTPGIPAREGAAELGVSEAEIVATGVGRGTVRLRGPWPDLLDALPTLGEVRAVTANGAAVSEQRGTYAPLRIEAGAPSGTVRGPEIDLRIAPAHWVFGFATHVTSRRGPVPALQFFDATGAAVHAVHGTDATDDDAWDAILEQFADPVQAPDLALGPAGGTASSDTGIAGLDWTSADRRPALQGAELLPRHAAHQLLAAVSARSQAIRIAVGNPGCLQLYTGPVVQIQVTGTTLEVLDPRFELHLDEARVGGAWRVPAASPGSPTLELLDRQGRQAAVFLAAHAPGTPEEETWRQILARLGSAEGVG